MQAGDKLRATGTVSGGTPGATNACVGAGGAIFVHDSDDEDNPIESNYAERDRLLELNHCDAETAPAPKSQRRARATRVATPVTR